MKEINSNGFNMADDTRKVRVEERLKIKIGEAKNLPGRSHGAACHRDIYCVLSLDQEEIFRTSTMERTLNPFFGEEFQFEVPRRFRYLSIYVFDRDKHLKQDKVLGKVAIKREDLHRYNNKDHWFALRPVDADSEVQGKAYIELSLEDSRKRLRMEPKPPDPDPAADNSSSKTKGKNFVRISEYCKESMRFGSCSSSTSKKLLSAVATEPTLTLSRSESLKDRAQWGTRTKPHIHTMSESDTPTPTAVDYWSDPERHCAARVGPDTLRLRVLECSELTTKNGQCDPFALVTLLYSNGRRVEKRTKPRKKTVNPQFDEFFCFDLVMDSDPKDKDASQSPGVACEARVSVWHDSATPVFLGEVRLQLRQPAPSPLRAWYFLTSRAGGALSRGATPPGTRLSAAGSATLGSLRLLLQYTVDHVFPLEHYKKLEELFLRSVHQKPIAASAVYILGEIVSSKTDAAQPLVRLFTHHDLIVPIVKELADAEISVLTDATTIFRGNTLVSKMMDEAMRLSGAAYLRSVLRPTLAAVLAERRPCEIDPARVKPSAAVTANLANLKEYVERVFGAITSSYAMCPAAMCRLFDALRQCAARHFPRNAEVRYSVVSGFIFLRFFAPAILGPRLFDLTTEQIDPQTNRTLTLISKTIQSLGNLVSSRSAQQVCKEEYMAELYRSFCTPRHVQAIRQFLEIISTSTDTQNNNIQETPVLLKEGTMIKRSEGVRAGGGGAGGGAGGGSPRRRWTRAAHAHAKRRHFRLTSGELTWSRCGAKTPAHRLPLSGVLAVAAVDCPPAGAPLGANNIFQIVHRERVLFVQAGNCVERAEWVRLLAALCRHSPAAPAHHGYYCAARWTCCGREQADAEGCGGCAQATEAGERETRRGPAALALRLDPARDLQRLHALLVAHAPRLDDRLHRPRHHHEGTTVEEREAEAATLRELQEAMFHLEHRHRTYRRSLARETKYGSKQAPIGDDNYLHLAGATGSVDSGQFLWRPWRSDTSPTVDLDGTTLPLQSSLDIGSSTESLKLGRHGDERSSGKSTKSTGSGYLTMSCLKHEPSEDSDGSAEKPARPPKPARLSPARAPLCEYVQVEPRPPERRPRRVDTEDYRCKEYELMTNFMSHSRPSEDDAPPAVPPRGQTASRARLHPKPELEVSKTTDGRSSPLYGTLCGSTGSLPSDEIRDDENECLLDKRDGRPTSKIDTVSNDDSLLDELQRDAYCVLKVCEDDSPEDEPKKDVVVESTDKKEKEDYGMFSRISIQRKSNPIKTHSNSTKPLKTSNSTSNVHDVGATPSRPLAERLTPFFFKKKPKPPDEAQAASRSARKEDNLIGRLTPRFGQSRLYGRGQSLELAPPESRTKRIERSATTVNIPRESRHMNSSIVANLKFLSLHRYGAQEDVQCRAFVRTDAEGAGGGAAGAAAAADARGTGGAGGAAGGDTLDAPAWRRPHAASLLAAATSDIRL
ncbi:GTPase-activating protein isoform X1 [Galleria mellonella]|uniref:GTPase-activating protein isoform X1 n=2 Tax=Galleria mellonella TaxID=7137 RepID=A0ABM3MQS1_GALME|nr:GTPase-activating protein isoform X1 [Galleria mellonella]